ncbi:hypothetical protein GPALN_006005 [Globodera pallida]|nr:hypothetical protein GPALN_006005 [Globodera pallida]
MAFFLTINPGIALLIFVHFVGAVAAGGGGDPCAFYNNKTMTFNGHQQQRQTTTGTTTIRLADGRCCYRTPTKYVCWQPSTGGGFTNNASSSVHNLPSSAARPAPVGSRRPVPSSDYYNGGAVCASVPAHVRRGCKMVAQIWAEGRKAEAEGNIVAPEDLPPPSSGIGLPCHRAATHAEQQAQPPPKVVAERYACLNMTCLCPFFGGVALAADHCTLNGAAASSSATASRPRRQSGTPNLSLGRAVRMEYRMLSDNQRARFHAALQQLKRGFGSYEYDRITFLHSSISMMPSAHGGPTFLLWHREYVKRLEIALRAVDPSVAVPYWDSALDGRLPNPADSIMWSNLFMGTPSGSGTIADGPLASWVTPSGGPIRRQLGGAGALFTEQQIAALIRTPQISQILAFTSQRGAGCTAPAPNPSNVLEFSHNNVHMWVGGDMGPLTTSPQDPVFFMHHSFVDYIFEQWRQLNQNRQQRETQYPDDAQIVACSGSANYRLGATMLPFQDPVMLNGAALSNSYTDNLYTYAPRPTCRAAGGCGSAYLFCDVISGGGPLCCAKIRPGGDCSRFASNAEQPCFSSTCVNGRCQAGGVAQPRFGRSIATAPLYRTKPIGNSYAHGGYVHVPNISYTTPLPPTPATTSSAIAWGASTTPSLTPEPPKERTCFDNHECCAQWAAKNACRTAPRYMNTWCPGSCRFDGCRLHPEMPQPQQQQHPTASTNCKDRHSQCERWAHFHETRANTAQRGECERNAHWMLQNCAKACGHCNVAIGTSPNCSNKMPKDYVLPMPD